MSKNPKSSDRLCTSAKVKFTKASNPLAMVTRDDLLHKLEMQNEKLRQLLAIMKEISDQFADLYDFAPVGYITMTQDGMITTVNFAVNVMLGVECGVLINQPFAKFIYPDDHELWLHHLGNVLRVDGPQNCVLRLKRKDGTLLYAQISSLQSDNAIGSQRQKIESKTSQKSQFLRVVITDICDRKDKKKELSENEEQFRLMFENTLQGVVFQNEHGEIISSNSKFKTDYPEMSCE